MSLNILKITDGRPGHITTTDGVIMAISRHFETKVFELKIDLRTKILLQLLKKLIHYRWFNKIVQKNINILKLFYKNFDLVCENVDFIVSTGGDTSFINVWLSRYLNVKNIYCSQLRGLDPKYFYLIISRTDLGLENAIYTETAPTNIEIDQSIVEGFCQTNHLESTEKYFVLMLGGNGGGYYYSKSDFEKIIHGFMAIVKGSSAKALITTSRRTGIQNEKYLMKLLQPYQHDVAYSVYFNHKAEKIVPVYLSLGNKVFITEESGSMISEALYYKKPVFTLRPEKTNDEPYYKKFLEDLITRRLVQSIYVNKMDNIDLESFTFNYLNKSPLDDLADKIQLFIGRD